MIKLIEGLLHTKDVTAFENRFIGSIVIKTNHGKLTEGLSERQIEVIESIHNKHFA